LPKATFAIVFSPTSEPENQMRNQSRLYIIK